MAGTGVVRAGFFVATGLGLIAGMAGCGVPRTAAGADAGSGPSNSAPAGGVSEPTAGAVAGDPYAKAIEWSIVPGVPSAITGTIQSSAQVDLFDIGPVVTGDRIHVEVLASSGLDAAAAILDADQDVLIVNDDRSYYGGLTDPLADAIVLHDSPRCYIAVSSSPLTPSTGSYTLEVLLSQADPPDPPTPQRVYLNFDGAWDVVIGTRAPVDVPAFDAASIDNRLAGDTEQIIDHVLDMVCRDFSGLGVSFYSSRAGAPPVEPYTTIHFGAYDAALLGIAENVDEYNERSNQQAIVFVDTFAAFAVLSPTAAEIAQALANVTSHETGHLLGLYHTRDPQGIMDISASLRQMLANQSFVRSPMHSEVFAIGRQDALGMLIENIGGDAAVAKAASIAQRAGRIIRYDLDSGPPARADRAFATCGACLDAKARRRASIQAWTPDAAQ